MRVAMGDTTLTTIPDLDNVECMEHNPPQHRLVVEPMHPIVHRYDLCLKVAEGEDQINLFHQAFTKWYSKIQEADSQIVLYPWTAHDQAENLMPVIENPTDIPLTLPNLKKFVHKLFLQTTRGDYHIQVLMGSQEDLATIMQTIGWWLKSTFQGMWLMDLQSSKETTCAGWLLFSAGNYNREALSYKIWEFTGVQVAIRFRVIKDRKKRDKNAKPDPMAPKPPLPIKALHVEIDKLNQAVNCSQIEQLYSSKVTIFPLGIKMQFVHDFCLLTNSQAKAKAECLKAHQEQFLNQMETCLMWEVAALDLEDHMTEATLCQMIMNLPDPSNPLQKLFHLVNMRFSQDAAILQFHPSKSQNARDVVAGLCIYLKGLWQGVIDDNKLNNFFTDTALDRAKDAWWEKCVVMQADIEMEVILKEDKDLIFPEKKVILELPNDSATRTETSQINKDILSTGSVSTFQTTATLQTQSTRKTKTKVKIPLAATSTSSNSATTLSIATLSEKDMTVLLGYIMKALALHNQTSNPNNSTQPGSDKSRKPT